MLTPVSTARQCLAEEAAATLEDAVAVAKRRGHGQTTSLHVISALIARPSSSLREACARAMSGPYSPRLQLRALELCVGVALDRVSACKLAGEDPPVSNSLMAAIKRSQANQRRHPETFHLYQQQLSSKASSQPSITVVKVELKHFILSILDDPVVSRVFGDAGYRNNDLKLAIMNPLALSRFSATSRCPPLFSSGLSGLELKAGGPNFPFMSAAESIDENLKRIGEIFAKRNKRNPLLIGAFAEDAFRDFIGSLESGKSGFLPREIDGLKLISIDHEISKFINEDPSEQTMGLKFKEVGKICETCEGPGIIVNCGNLKFLVGEGSTDCMIYIVSQMKQLLYNSEGRLRLIGFLTGDGDYKKLLERFPTIEMDLDLQLLPLSSSKPSVGGKYFKSSLMRSFVPFGGFFSMPSYQEVLGSKATQSSSLCSLCSEKCEQEVSALKRTSTDSVADIHSINLSCCLRMDSFIKSKKSDTVEARDDKTAFGFRVIALRRKWSDICQRLHHICTTQEGGSKVTKITPLEFPTRQLLKPECSKPVEKSTVANVQLEQSMQGLETNHLQKTSYYQQQTSLPSSCSHASSVLPVTTDLGLGTLYASDEDGSRKPNLQEHYYGIQTSNEMSRTHANSPIKVLRSSLCSHQMEKQICPKDFEHQWKLLSEKVFWQIEAIQMISQSLLCCGNGDVGYQCPKKGSHWLGFLGPDKVGKRKIASALAEIFFGGPERLLSLDLSAQDVAISNSMFDNYGSMYRNKESERKMIVDCLAEKLSKRPHSVVLLENIDKADFLVQNSLSQAVKTGKFPDSHGRDFSINNIIFVITSRFLKGGEDSFEEETLEFSEEKILEVRNVQMKILVVSVGGVCSCNRRTANVSLTPICGSNVCPVNKRKMINNNSTKSKRVCQLSRSIDLNLPVDSMGEDLDMDIIDEDGCDPATSTVWLEEFLENLDKNVTFKPFAFNSLCQKILKEIDARVQRVVGTKTLLEIDREVMAQLLAAAWLTDKKGTFENWIEEVLCPSIQEALQRCNATSDFVLRLVACDDLLVTEQASGVRLPARINID